MITWLVTYAGRGFVYVRQHPQLALVIGLLLILPLLFWYTNTQFLEAGQSNQDRLQKDRVGMLHDAFASLLIATDFDITIAQREIERLAALNPDVKAFRVVVRQPEGFVPIAALTAGLIGQPESGGQLYKDAVVRLDESMIFEFQTVNGREWYAYRAVESTSGELHVIFTQLSLAAVDALFARTASEAMWTLVFIYAFIVILAYWHVRMTDYYHLYHELERANKTRDLFTNMIAHELRAPLTAIRGYASMLQESLTDSQAEQAKRIGLSSERLLALVNDMLDVARIQSGKLSVERTLVNVSTVIDHVVTEQRVTAEQKNITIVTEGTDVEHELLVDEKRFQQALTNVISNAIKYTQQGSITVSAAVVNEQIEIRVKDTGMGIAHDDQHKLFAPFFRVRSDSVDQITGTGLGMWITKELIELMGGQIGIESIKGVGTHVVIKFLLVTKKELAQ